MKHTHVDNRAELSSGAVLAFPGMECVIDECIGRGSNALVYLGHYYDAQIQNQQHRILIKELYPFDSAEGIWREQSGDIVVEDEAEAHFAMHKKSYLSGNRFHLKFLEKNPGELDSHINTFAYHNTLYSILEFTGGRSILQELEKHPDRSLERIVFWMKGLLNVLKVFHEEGYLHLDISLDNILLIGEGEKERVTLIDYNSIVSLDELQEDEDVVLSVKQEYVAPEILRADRTKIGIGTDLYAVTAVFFYLLYGRGRSVGERVKRFSLPNSSESPILENANPIVCDMIFRIMKKGFDNNVCRRYQSVEQMRMDLDELEDRIKCRGITQWALWQKGKEYVANIVNRNAALRYIMDPEKIYPLHAGKAGTNEGMEEVINLSNPAFLRKMSGSTPVLLLGSGGMGKTTTMLRLIYEGPKHYSAGTTAMVYVSLFDWRNGDKTYIQDKILENLDFSHEVLADARKELQRLLAKPDKNRDGEVPRLLLCLDGLNEAAGDIAPLLDEIQKLCSLSGVRILLTSRSEIAGNEYEKWVITRLEREEVRTILNKNRIPLPENMEIMELLYNPMMLSIYMKALDGRKLLKLDSREELLKEYLSVLIRKEARDPLYSGEAANEQDNPATLGAQVAVKYVLPEIAALIQKKKRSLTEQEMYHCVEQCYKYLEKRAFIGVFDTWIGHAKQLKLETKTADEWYGKIILDILWRRLGLLVLDENSYRISHQILEEYCSGLSRQFHVDFDAVRKKNRQYKTILAITGTVAAVFSFLIYNTYMLSSLNHSQRQMMEKNAQYLVQASETLLAQGDRKEAEKVAMEALQSAGDQAFVHDDAVFQYNEATYRYREPMYHADRVITWTDTVYDAYISDDGRYMIVLDSDHLRCFETETEKEIWSYAPAYMPIYDGLRPRIEMLHSLHAVLCADYENTVLLSLETGEILRNIPMGMDDELKGLPVVLEEKGLLLFGGSDQQSFQLSVYDLTTGAFVSADKEKPWDVSAEVFKEAMSFPKFASFLGDEIDIYHEKLLVGSTDREGEIPIIQTAMLRQGGLYAFALMDMNTLETNVYAEMADWELQEHLIEGGAKLLLTYQENGEADGSEYPAGYVYSGKGGAGFIGTGDDAESVTWKEDSCGACLITVIDETFIWIENKEAVCIDQEGNEIVRSELPEAVCYSRQEGDQVFLVLKDGSCLTMDLRKLMADESHSSIRYSGRNQITPEHVTVSRVTTGSETMTASGVTTGSETMTASGVTTGSETMTASGVATDSVTTSAGMKDDLLCMISENGSSVLIAGMIGEEPLGRIPYVGEEKNWIIPEKDKLKIHEAIGAGDDQLPEIIPEETSLSVGGKNITIRWEYEGENILENLAVNSNFPWSETLISTETWIVLPCTTTRTGFTDPVEYYMAYSIPEEKWVRISGIGNDKDPMVMISEKQKELIVGSTDGILRSYDLETGTEIAEYTCGVPMNLITTRAGYILEDRYILLRSYGSEGGIMIIDREAKAVVYAENRGGDDFDPDHPCYYADSETDYLYIWGVSREDNGLCIDMNTWKTICVIPELCGIVEGQVAVLAENQQEMLLYPLLGHKTEQ